MRYTTVIDISEYPPLYNCLSARLIYFHLTLKAGWGERNQDYCRASIRSLQADLGLSFSAVRHGLNVLTKTAMIRKTNGGYLVRKFCTPTQPGQRAKTRRELQIEETRRAEMKHASELIEKDRAERAAAAAARSTAVSYEKWKRMRENESNPTK